MFIGVLQEITRLDILENRDKISGLLFYIVLKKKLSRMYIQIRLINCIYYLNKK